MKTFNILDYGAKMCDALQTEAIQKAIESYRIPPEQKESLRGLKR